MKLTALAIFCSITFTVIAQVNFTESVLMKDGIRLSTEVYLTEDSFPQPTVLIRTPYKAKGAKIFAEYFRNYGFNVAVQDVRGKYDSEGTFIPFINEYKDGIQTLDWLASQSWCNGKIGMWGSSYLGFSALLMAQSEHPNLESIFSISGWIDGELINSPGGAFHQMLVIPWLLLEGQKSRKSVKGMDLQEIFNHTPLNEVVPETDFYKNNTKRSLATEDLSDRTYNYDKVAIPILQMGGWFDFATNASIKAYQNVKNNGNAPQHLVLGPWYHNQIYDENEMLGIYKLPESGRLTTEQMLELSCKWFEKTLLTDPSISNEVIYYVLFEDDWKRAKKWPPKNSTLKKFFLRRERITADPPREEISVSKFIYNPEQATETKGGSNFHLFLNNIGAQEQVKPSSKNDMLFFKSEPASAASSFAGEVNVELFVESEGRSTDFTAKLCKVDTAGTVINLVDGILRIKQGELSNSSPVKITIELGNIAFQLKKGEAMELRIASSNFPKFNRNPNTGVDPMDAVQFKSVEQIIHHSKQYPSALIIHQLKE